MAPARSILIATGMIVTSSAFTHLPRTTLPRTMASARVARSRVRASMAVEGVDMTSLVSGLSSSGMNLATTAADYEFQGSYASLYVTLGLFVLSFPGIISLVTRATKIKPDQRTYVLPGPLAPENEKPIRQVAAEIMAYFQANNYKVDTAGETIIFKGIVEKSKSQAFFLSACMLGGLWCLALVLSIQVPKIGPLEVGNWYYLLCLASPYAGYYYWQNAQGDDEVRVRLVDNDVETELTVMASKEELERFAQVMDYNEKGKIRIRGIFEAKPEE